MIREATVAKEPGHRGEHEISRKTIARGMPGVSGVTVVSNSCAFYTLHTRPRAHRAPGIPCALDSLKGGKFPANLALPCGEIAKLCPNTAGCLKLNP
jgi:hypothetical protein